MIQFYDNCGSGKIFGENRSGKTEKFYAMNETAARLLELGHTPIIGVNAALPVVERADVTDKYEAIMQISVAAISICEAILVISNSKGADRELDFFIAEDKPIYYSIGEVPLIF